MYSLEDLKKKSKILQSEKDQLVKRQSGSTLQTTSNNRSKNLELLRTNLNLSTSTQTSKNIEQKITSMSRSILPEAAKIYNDNKVNLICFFDKSGSCRGTEQATILGYRELIKNQKCYPTFVTTILFDEYTHIINNEVDIKSIPELNYYAEGGTSLYDVLVQELSRIKYERTQKGTEREKTIVAIMTDGLDEHSKKYNEIDTRNIINACRDLGWEFIFLGANQNAQLIATNLGIDPKNAEVFQATREGFYLNFKAIEKALESFRLEGKVTPDWSKVVKENNLLALGDGRKNEGPTLTLGSGR